MISGFFLQINWGNEIVDVDGRTYLQCTPECPWVTGYITYIRLPDCIDVTFLHDDVDALIPIMDEIKKGFHGTELFYNRFEKWAHEMLYELIYHVENWPERFFHIMRD